MVVLALTAALAQSPPLAVPLEGSAAPREEAVPLSGDRLRAIREYRARHLRLVSEVSYRMPAQPGRGFGDGDGWVQPTVPVEVLSRTIYEGGTRLEVPELYVRLGEPERGEEVRRSVLRDRRIGTTLYTLGAMGALTAVGGFIAMERAQLASASRMGGTTAVAGLGAMGVGFVVGTFPITRARRLQYDPGRSMAADALDTSLQTYNEALRLELGLRQSDIVLIERATPPVVYPVDAEE